MPSSATTRASSRPRAEAVRGADASRWLAAGATLALMARHHRRRARRRPRPHGHHRLQPPGPVRAGLVGPAALRRRRRRDRARPADRGAPRRCVGRASRPGLRRSGAWRSSSSPTSRAVSSRPVRRSAPLVLATLFVIGWLRYDRQQPRSRPGRADGRRGHRRRDAAGRRRRLRLPAAVARAASPSGCRCSTAARRSAWVRSARGWSTADAAALAPATRPLLRAGTSMPSLPLGRFRMLDLSRQLPGPFCSTLLADLGMDVLVVTAPRDPFGLGIPFLARNKRSMTLDLKTGRGTRRSSCGWSTSADVAARGLPSRRHAASRASTGRRCARAIRASSTAPSPATGRTARTATRSGTTSTTSATPACSSTPARRTGRR